MRKVPDHSSGKIYVLYSEPPQVQVRAGGIPEGGGTPGERYPCLNPVNPDMRDESKRLKSFDDRWPVDSSVSVHDLTKAGFVCIDGGRVKCWYCNGGLQDWKPGDDPWVEHAKWFPSCEFLLEQKGPEFVKNELSRQEKTKQVRILVGSRDQTSFFVIVCMKTEEPAESHVLQCTNTSVHEGDEIKVILICEEPKNFDVHKKFRDTVKINQDFAAKGKEELNFRLVSPSSINAYQSLDLRLIVHINGKLERSIPVLYQLPCQGSQD